MSDPLSILKDEHRIIERALDRLERFATGLALAGERSEARAELARYVRFIREFADNLHHGKEEGLLFTALCAHGLPRDAGPVGVMLAEHQEARRQTALLAQIARASGPLDAREVALVRRVAFAYAELMRDHIAKEDNVLYPMAVQRLPAPRLLEIAQSFGEYDLARGTSHREELAALVATAAAPTAALRHAVLP